LLGGAGISHRRAFFRDEIMGRKSSGDHIRTLKRRLAFIANQINSSNASAGAMNYLKSERMALTWALETLNTVVATEEETNAALQHAGRFNEPDQAPPQHDGLQAANSKPATRTADRKPARNVSAVLRGRAKGAGRESPATAGKCAA
jgi:hypothetical protein